MPSFGFGGSSEGTVRILPTVSSAAAAQRLERLKAGQCASLVMAGVRGWTLAELCAVLEATTHLAAAITALDFSQMGLDELFLGFVIDIIDRCPLLRRLDLEDNFFTSEASCVALGKAIAGKTQLGYVNVVRCRMSNEGALGFLKAAFSQSSSNVKLVSDDSNKGTSSASSSASPFRGFSLHIAHNQITDTFAKGLAAMIRLPNRHHLNSISFFGNFITNEEGAVLHKASLARRTIHEGKGMVPANGVTAAAATRTSLGLLVTCAGPEEDARSFPMVVAMANMLAQEEGL